MFVAFVILLFYSLPAFIYIFYVVGLMYERFSTHLPYFVVCARAVTITFLWPKLRKLYPSHYFLVIFPFSIFCVFVWCAVGVLLYIFALLSFAVVSFSYWYIVRSCAHFLAMFSLFPFYSVHLISLLTFNVSHSLSLSVSLFASTIYRKLVVEPIRIERGNEKQREKGE